MFLERNGIAGAPEICWLDSEKTSPGRAFLHAAVYDDVQHPPPVLARVSLDQHKAFLAFAEAFPGEVIHHPLPQELPDRCHLL